MDKYDHLARIIAWPITLPWAWAEFGAAVAANMVQAAEIMMTRRMG